VVVFQLFAALIGPVFIAPLFNTYTTLTEARVREPILRMARANGIAVDNVYVVDQSRQTTRVSANVSGVFGTTRDNLLRRASSPTEGTARRFHPCAWRRSVRPKPRCLRPH
jgi:STE24 endopeptidase